MNPSSKQQQTPSHHHRRRISEPPDLMMSRQQQQQQPPRQRMTQAERSQSTRDLAAVVAPTTTTSSSTNATTSTTVTTPARTSFVDVSQFQDSWTNASFLEDHHHHNNNNNNISRSSNVSSSSSLWGGGAGGGAATSLSLASRRSIGGSGKKKNNNNNTATAVAAVEPGHPLVSTSHFSSLSLSADAITLATNATTTAATTTTTTTTSSSTIAPSAIHDAARITDWDAVLELCHSHPELASYQGSVGYTALHHACNRRCPRTDVVQALLEASGGGGSGGGCSCLYQQEDEKGWLPLHFACRFKMPRAAVQLLLEYDTGKWTVSKRDRLGRTPLFYAIRYDAPAGVVELLLQQDPAVILAVDENDDSPLKLVWDAWADKLQGKRIVHSFLPGGFECKDATAASSVQERAKLLRERLPTEHKLYHKWKKANLLLQAAFGFPVTENAAVVASSSSSSEDDEDEEEEEELKKSSLLETKTTSTTSNDNKNENTRTWRIVHATTAVKCHLSLFLLACALHPEQVAELDENDLRRDGSTTSSSTSTTTRPPHQTALHLAASSNADGEAGKAVILTLLSLHREAAEVQDGIDGSLPLHRMVENERKRDWPQHAAILYHFYPRAVQVADFNGRLPLHRAAAAMTPQAATQQQHHHHTTNDDGGEGEQDDDMSEERSVIIQLVRAFPQAASRADSAGYFPLHLAAQNATAWDENLQAIYNAHRAAVLARAGPDSRLALHMAAANPKAEASLIERLLELHPRAASMPDRHGNLPLHLACAQGRDWQIVRLIYEAFPPAIHHAREGWLPLHMACAAESEGKDSPDNDLIARLVAVYPAAASVPDRNGQYPLHLACGSGKSWKTGGLEALVHAGADVTATPDAAGRMPFHVAALKCCQPEKDSESTAALLPPWLKSHQEDCAKETAELDILFELLRADPTIL